jgi:hypothetical protein
MLHNISGRVSETALFCLFFIVLTTHISASVPHIGSVTKKNKNVKKITTTHIYAMTFTVHGGCGVAHKRTMRKVLSFSDPHSLSPNPDSPKNLVPHPGFK